MPKQKIAIDQDEFIRTRDAVSHNRAAIVVNDACCEAPPLESQKRVANLASSSPLHS